MPPKIRKAEFVKAIVKPGQAPPPLPGVAFAGRSNVGKSSLINKLTGNKGLARTSSTPGRTQEIIYFEIENTADERWHFIDLPGYGYAQAPEEVRRRWGPMVEGYLREAPALKLVVVILDSRREPSDLDRQLIEWLTEAEIPFIFAVTKCDKLGKGELARHLASIPKALGIDADGAVIPVSSQTGLGIGDLMGVIRRTLEGRGD